MAFLVFPIDSSILVVESSNVIPFTVFASHRITLLLSAIEYLGCCLTATLKPFSAILTKASFIFVVSAYSRYR